MNLHGSMVVLALVVLASYPQVKSQTESLSNGFDLVDKTGNIRKPADFRDLYQALGVYTPVDLNGDTEMHYTYASPGTAEYYRRTGKFADGTVLVKETFGTDHAQMTTGDARWATNTKVWFVMIKDDKNRYPGNPLWSDGWGWALFKSDAPDKQVATDYTTEPSENLPPRVLRTAEMIGVRSQVEELVQLRSAPKRDDIRELRLAQRLQGVVIASALDVESVNARIDYETAHLQEVQVYLSARRDRRVDLLNLGNLFIGGGVGAVGSGLQLISSAGHAGNVVSTSAGFGGTVLSVIGLQQQKGQLRSPEYTPAMLTKLLGNSPLDSSDYPQEVWVYLTTPDPTLPHGSTGQEHLVSEWTRFGHLKEKPDPKTMAALTTTGKDGTKLSIEMIGERTAMLADVRAHVSTMLVDLAELMMFVAQQN